MISARSLAIAISWVVLSTPLIYAQDLSQYRKLQFGMNLLSAAQQTGMKPSEARTIHQRPALIQELEWRPQHFVGDPSLKTDPVRDLLLSFYSDELFRIVVTYDRYRTEGLTDEDMIEALSAKYGPATRPTAKTISFSSSVVYNNTENVIACWEDAQYSFNLFRSYSQTLGILVFSKRLDALARAAVVEALRLDNKRLPNENSNVKRSKMRRTASRKRRPG